MLVDKPAPIEPDRNDSADGLRAEWLHQKPHTLVRRKTTGEPNETADDNSDSDKQPNLLKKKKQSLIGDQAPDANDDAALLDTPATIRRVTTNDLSSLYEKYKTDLDPQKTGYVSEKQLDAAILNPKLDDQETQVVVALKHSYDDLCSDKTKGISSADMQKFDKEQQKVHAEALAVDKMVPYFLNNWIPDSGLSKDDIESALKSAKGYDLQGLTWLKSNFDHIAGAGDTEPSAVKPDRIYQTDLQQYQKDFYTLNDPTKDIHAADLWGNQGRIVDKKTELVLQAEVWMTRARDVFGKSDQLYDMKNDPLNCITPGGVNQGDSGDCYFMARLSSLASTNKGRDEIQKMLTENSDGTFTVKFPGADKPITVNKPTPAELALYNTPDSHGIWASVIEKAYGESLRGSSLRNKYKNINEDGLAQEIADKGDDYFTHADEMLTGKKPISIADMPDHLEQIHNELVRSFKEGLPASTGADSDPGLMTDIYRRLFSPEDAVKPIGNDPSGKVLDHQYAVINYDPDTRTVTLRNPYGFGIIDTPENQHRSGSDDGIFTMSLKKFAQTFSDVDLVK